MNTLNKSDVVKEAASGRWLEILAAIAPDLKDAIKERPNHVLDPVNGGKNGDGFRLFKDAARTGGGVSNHDGVMSNGFDLLMWATKSSFQTILNDVADYLDLNHGKYKTIQSRAIVRSANYNDAPIKKTDTKTLEKRRYALRNVWMKSYELNTPQASLGRTYFANRGIDLSQLVPGCLSKTMRFHPALEMWHRKRLIGRFPALVTLVSYDDSTPACIHRTYLDQYGNKLKIVVDECKVPTKKLMMRCQDKCLSGGAIMLGTPSSLLDVSEGIETGLSVMQSQHRPVWPCVNTTMLAKLNPPKGVKHVVVWADKDREKNGKCAGLYAARELENRMSEIGVKVTIMLPEDHIPETASSVDWNDVHRQHGLTKFPTIQSQ